MTAPLDLLSKGEERPSDKFFLIVGSDKSANKIHIGHELSCSSGSIKSWICTEVPSFSLGEG
jgi:hypothetical protein